MNNTIYLDSKIPDEERRQQLYDGQLFVYSPTAAGLAFVKFAAAMIEDAFGGLDPQSAQDKMSVDEYAALLGELKPRFIHHPESKQHINRILEERGCDLERSYFDVPRMRTSTSDGYLTTGIAYAWHPHRDTWYSAPPCQINWWLPIFDFQSDNAMAFHPNYWSEPVENSSSGYNYYVWNKKFRGAEVAKLTRKDDRPLPRATQDLKIEPQVRVVCPAGGLVLFSAAQMHSSVPNTSGVTRFSIDFRTVNIEDARQRRGAPLIDSASTGTTMRDFQRCTDLVRMPDEVIAMYDDGSSAGGDLLYEPQAGVSEPATSGQK